jgi:hypothetical protein
MFFPFSRFKFIMFALIEHLYNEIVLNDIAIFYFLTFTISQMHIK